MDYDKLIEDNQELKRWQYCVAGLLWLPTLSAGLNIMSYTFAGFTPPHRCHLPCEAGDYVKLEDTSWYQSLDTSTTSLDTQCQFYKYLPSEAGEAGGCHARMFNTSEIVSCTSYVYDRSVFQETLVTNFDLVCQEKWKKGFIGDNSNSIRELST